MKTRIILAVLLLSTSMLGQNSEEGIKGTIYGVAIDPDGHRAKRLMLVTNRPCPAPQTLCMIAGSPPNAITNQSGEFRFAGLPPGKYTVFAADERAGYSYFMNWGDDSRSQVEITPEHRDVELRLELPPRGAFLEFNLTNRQTGATIPKVAVSVEVAEGPRLGLSLRVTFNRPGCSWLAPSCAIVIPPDTEVRVHVSSEGFQEWDESAGAGKSIRLRSGAYQKLDIQLDPVEN
jgi:hypothetical protein